MNAVPGTTWRKEPGRIQPYFYRRAIRAAGTSVATLRGVMHPRGFVVLPLLTLAWACGGQSLNNPGEGESGAGGDSGKGGSSSGGTAGAGGSTGGTTSTGGTGGTSTGGTGGTSTGGTGGTISSGGTAGTSAGGSGAFAGTGAGGSGGFAGSGQCLALPTCPPDEIQVSSAEYCNAGTVCHQLSLCGSTIWCTGQPLCDAIPLCDAGDEELPAICPPDGSCYSRTVCGQTIYCLDHCNPDTEPNRQYLLTSCGPGDIWECNLENTTSFVNECGCGCEQDATCPPNLYCILPIALERAAPPGSDPAPDAGTGMTAPLCTDEQLAQCPFSDALGTARP